MSRRKALGGMGAVLAAAAVSKTFAEEPTTSSGTQTPATSSSTHAEAALENPVTKYPQPPFESQFQPWPGLVSKMNPRPDHGEKVIKVPVV